MVEGKELVSHSNRGIAVLIATLSLAILGWLLVSNRSDEFAESVPTTTATPQTSAVAIAPFWEPLVDPTETDLGEHQLPGGRMLLLSSSGGDAAAVPIIRRLDPEGRTVLWAATGRGGADWIGPPQLSGDTVLLLSREQGGRGVLLGFDLLTGSRLWISQFSVRLPPFAGTITVVDLGDEVAVMVQTLDLGLIRLAVLTGSPLWTVDLPAGRVSGPEKLRGNRVAISIDDGGSRTLVDAQTGQIVDEADVAEP